MKFRNDESTHSFRYLQFLHTDMYETIIDIGTCNRSCRNSNTSSNFKGLTGDKLLTNPISCLEQVLLSRHTFLL